MLCGLALVLREWRSLKFCIEDDLMNILEMATTACNNDLVNSDEGCNLAPPPAQEKGEVGYE